MGILDSGEALSTQQVTDALSAANDLLDSWSIEQILVYQAARNVQTLSAATQSYAIGTGLTWDQPRPAAIVAAAVINAAGPGTEVHVCTAREWAAIEDRQSSSYLIKHLFYDRAVSNGQVYVSPIPLGSGLTIELITYNALTQFADTTSPIAIPAGYLRALKLGLAIELAPQYDMQPSQALAGNYQAALNHIKDLNAKLFGDIPAAGSPQAQQQQQQNPMKEAA